MKFPFKKISIAAGAVTIILISLLLNDSSTPLAQGQTTALNNPLDWQNMRTNLTEMQSQINKLNQRVATLEKARSDAYYTIPTPLYQQTYQNTPYRDQRYSSTTPVNIPSTVTVNQGSYVDFIGRNYGIEEDVQVIQNGQIIRTAHADGGGNFSTGAIQVPFSQGTISYSFRGLNSGMTRSATVVVRLSK